jgi:ABC-type glucose/galactose transport system permease subunit
LRSSIPVVLALALGFAIAILFLPLLIFAIEVARDPNLLRVQVNIASFDQSPVTLNITLSYAGTVPLTDAWLSIGNRSIGVGGLHKGDVKTITTSLIVGEVLSFHPSDVSFQFKVMGIYGVEVKRLEAFRS